MNRSQVQSRRRFLKQAAAATAVAAGGAATEFWPAYGRDSRSAIALVTAPNDVVVQQAPVQWALEQLRATLKTRGLVPQNASSVREVKPSSECIVVASGTTAVAAELIVQAGVALSPLPEALGLARGKIGGRKVLLAGGSDARGLVYALLELADLVGCAADPTTELKAVRPIIQKPANEIRSVARLFTSEIEDKPWFYDRAFWQRYLTELATHRFNRFSLTLGLGYDFPTDIRDAYFHFAYPFLISTPGYLVRAVPLPDAERERNLEMLQFIGLETVRRGLHFQLGLWTHAYQWIDSPNANYVIEGLSPETHAAYCRDSVEALLRACPAIGGLTFRVHGESGIAEGSYEFWKTVFSGVARCGRVVEIDMHAKGIDDQMIELALATGMPIKVSPKFWAEHMGLGYMQGAIRSLEMPPPESQDAGFFAKSSGSRRFLRYGYGDLLKENRRYGVLHRIWPGTQRLLLWGDPELAADYGRSSSFCGSSGVEWCEPLSFKGRKGSGLAGGRDAYADPELRPPGGDFEKYLYSYRVWGRRIYDPDSPPDPWRRWLRQKFGPKGAQPVEAALHHSSQILPLFTTAHCPSAANNNYWPEMYTNMSIVDAKRPHPYGDTPSPKRFGAVSSLDPEFFQRIDDFAEELFKDAPSAKYPPAWVAATLESAALHATEALTAARSMVRDHRSPDFRRLAADVAIESGLGRFFAWKIRAAALFALHERSHYRPALEQAITSYRKARDAWAQFAQEAASIYRRDVAFGPGNFQRGHWLDRLPEIDADLAVMEALSKETSNSRVDSNPTEVGRIRAAIQMILRTLRALRARAASIVHSPPKVFQPHESLTVELLVHARQLMPKLEHVHLRYRRVNQAEVWQAVVMESSGATYRAIIPAEYTNSRYPLQYHFELRNASGEAWLFPGLKPGHQGQPYFVVRQV